MLLLDSGHFNPLLKILQWPPLPERGCSISLIWHPMLCPAPVSWRAPSALKHLSEPPKGQRLCCAHPSSAPTSPWSLEALISSASHYSSGRRWVPSPHSRVTHWPGQDTDHVPPGPRGSLPTVSGREKGLAVLLGAVPSWNHTGDLQQWEHCPRTWRSLALSACGTLGTSLSFPRFQWSNGSKGRG